ncbi:MAG: DUF4935 domain-containing protein [Alphaproteobacteria bacterium]|nr:DUF4935 domain-containing protein [Alphaproteobacteria bacterium]MBU1828113.1 DUF4935 domain-containing protein [Alphaproteobacteria bacterium]
MNESFFRSAQAQAFLKACSILQVTVVIPDIVIDEVLGNFPKKLIEKTKAFQNAQKELGRLIDLGTQLISVSEEIDGYEDWLYELIEEKGVLTHPYPEISLKDLVQKSYENEKPFKENGEGHKDFLVWGTIKNHIESKATTPPNYFLTNNTKDFAAKGGDDKDILHPNLAKEIEEDVRRPKLYTSLKAAFDKILAPNLQNITLGEIPDLNADDIQRLVDEYLLEDLPQRTAFGFEGVPFSNDVSITGVSASEVGDVQLKKVDDEVVINVNGTVEIEVSGFIEKHAYYLDLEVDEGPDISVVDSDWNDHVMAVSSEVETAFELSLFYSVEDKEVTGYEVSLPQEIEDDWYQ